MWVVLLDCLSTMIISKEISVCGDLLWSFCLLLFVKDIMGFTCS